MNTLIAFGIILVGLFSAGVGFELRKGLKEDKKYN